MSPARPPESQSLQALGALAQPTRLAAFRLLVREGPNGVSAGEIARQLNVPHNTMSGHLAELSHAGLARARRDGRNVHYAANLDGLAGLVEFLVGDCCGGRPDECGDSHPLFARIADLARARSNPVTEHRPYNVLILCTGNSARSLMAEAILSRLGQGKFHAFSAGSRPKGAINPEAKALLSERGYDVSWLRSKSWSEFARPGSPEMDFVFTVCDDAAGEECPVWPGHPMTAHWGITDPAAAKGSPVEIRQAFADAYRYLYNRISLFVALPFDKLDQLALKSKLHEIGNTEGATRRARTAAAE